MGRGKFKAKPTGQRHFSTPEELLAGTSSRPRTFKRQEAEYKEEEEEESGQESGEESDDETDQKRKGTQGVIEINNPNLVKPKNLKAGDVDTGKTTELSRREREELEKQRAHERYMRLQEQGKTEQARKDLGKLIRYCYTSYQTYLCYFLHLSDSKYSLPFGASVYCHFSLKKKDKRNKKTYLEFNCDTERLALIRQQREEAARKREEEKAAKEQKKAEARK
ncbi:Casein kinase substrate [Theobroma cacao]|nr:Casein kinase substrate [Theobroma cacao]